MLTLTAFLLQATVAGVFLASGLAKALDGAGRETWAALAARLPVRRFPVRAAAYAHTAAELLLGAALSAGTWMRVPALGAATVLFTAFTLLALYSAQPGNAVPCACFGSSRTPLGWPHVGRNLALTGVAAAGLACALAVGPALPTSPGGIAVALAAAAAVTAVTFFFDDLVDLFRADTPGVSSPRT
ncbi:MauE/DoxX family redox-associated membrane protein [Nocardiopsis changdeensis]|uniref:MauE/DoxX family redox-associated membrane protein n=1 Tax=Nocardiopsis changdeensis TaxID=2831969 RepID=UPI003F4847F2